MERNSDWVCINCGKSLGMVMGGEFYPSVQPELLRTSGPNLSVTCPECGSVKTWYSSDPVVRAIYQLVNSMSEVAARAMVKQIGEAVNKNKF